MDKKPKAGGAKKKAPLKKAEDEKQFERFVETAGQIGASEKSFDEAFAKIVKAKT